MNLRRTISLIGGIGLTITASSAFAQGAGGLLPTATDEPTRQGTRGANFLHIPIGARANAMGGALGSSVTGPMAWYWNPAGASSSEGFSVAAGRQNLYGDLKIGQTYAAGSFPLLGGVVGANLNSLSSGNMDRIIEQNPFGTRSGGGSFAWTSTSVGLGYARRLTDRLAIGGTLNYITEGITDASTHWVGVDLGTQFNTGIYGLTLGGAIQHIGGQSQASGAAIRQLIATNQGDIFRENRAVNLLTNQVELPAEFRFSLGLDVLGTSESLLGQKAGKHRLYLEANANDATDISPQAGLGAEYSFRNVFFARGGKRFYGDKRTEGMAGTSGYGLSGGFGLRLPLAGRKVQFDYSYTGMADLQNTQVFSIEVGR